MSHRFTRCPGCNKPVKAPHYEVDIVHDCFNQPRDEVLKNEDVPVVGPWSDADGASATEGLSVVPSTRGIINELGLDPEAQTQDVDRVMPRSARGAPADTTRERERFTYIKLK